MKLAASLCFLFLIDDDVMMDMITIIAGSLIGSITLIVVILIIVVGTIIYVKGMLC